MTPQERAALDALLSAELMASLLSGVPSGPAALTQWEGQQQELWAKARALRASRQPPDPVKELVRLLKRYREETPLGHQPHMIAGEVDAAIAALEARKDKL